MVAHGYGAVDWTRGDISRIPALSIDLRAETGAPRSVAPRDETHLAPAGAFGLAVCGGSSPPIGEIRIWFGGREIRIVGALTGRPGLLEVTPDHLATAMRDDGYRGQMLAWLGLTG